MNAVAHSARTHTDHKTNTFKWLLKREFWENRGGFIWAPAITGAIFLTMTLLGMGIASVFFQKARSEPGFEFEMEAGGNAAQHAQAMGFAGDVSLLIGAGLALLVLAFVVFFYALGSLYDDRRDRSVLFWKSMPVSDTQTVLSKVVWALLLAPAIAVVVGLVIGLALWALSLIAAAVNGLPAAGAMLTHSNPLRVVGNILVILPVYALWALPTVGWLMFCSAWARKFPFLWAVLLPMLTCVMVSLVAAITGAASGINFPYGELWYVLVYRGLLSVIPGTWYSLPAVHEKVQAMQVDSPDDIAQMIDLTQGWYAFATLDLWIGVAVGVAFIAGATYLRRWRELAD